MNVDGEIRTYRESGYVVVRGLFRLEEMARMRAECQRLAALIGEPGAPADDMRLISRKTLSGAQCADRIDPVRDLSPLVEALTADPRVLGVASAMMEEDVLLMKDKLVFKNPGVHGYEVHQDYHAWQELPPPPESMLSVLVAVDAANAENGAVCFYPGMHGRPLNQERTPTNLFGSGSGVVPEKDLVGRHSETIPLASGDAVIFSSLAPHYSGPNYSASPRRSLFLTFSAARYGDLYQAYYRMFRSYRQRDAEAAQAIGAPQP